MEIDYKHTWVLSRRAWYVKLYLFVWEADPSEITFCKLWWAYWFLPVGAVLKTFLSLGRGGRGLYRLALRGARKLGREAGKERAANPKPQELAPHVAARRATAGRRTTLRTWNKSPFFIESWDWGDESDASYYLYRCYHEFYKLGRLGHTYKTPGDYVIKGRVRKVGSDLIHQLSIPIRVHPKPSVSVRTLERGEDIGSAVINGVGTGGRLIGTVTKPVLKPAATAVTAPSRKVRSVAPFYVWCVFMVVWALFAVAGFMKLLGTMPSEAALGQAGVVAAHSAVTVAPLIGAAVGIAATLILTVVGVALLVSSGSWLERALEKTLAAIFWTLDKLFWPILHDFRREKAGLSKCLDGLGEFGDLMRLGYVSVKSNTCPRVEIEDEEEATV